MTGADDRLASRLRHALEPGPAEPGAGELAALHATIDAAHSAATPAAGRLDRLRRRPWLLLAIGGATLLPAAGAAATTGVIGPGSHGHPSVVSVRPVDDVPRQAPAATRPPPPPPPPPRAHPGGTQPGPAAGRAPVVDTGAGTAVTDPVPTITAGTSVAGPTSSSAHGAAPTTTPPVTTAPPTTTAHSPSHAPTTTIPPTTAPPTTTRSGQCTTAGCSVTGSNGTSEQCTWTGCSETAANGSAASCTFTGCTWTAPDGTTYTCTFTGCTITPATAKSAKSDP